MALQIIPDWMANLEDEDVSFIKRFILASGSLKEMASSTGLPIRRFVLGLTG